MSVINDLTQINYAMVFISIVIIGCSIKFLWELIDFLAEKLGIEFRRERIMKEEHNLLMSNIAEVNALKNIQEKRYDEIDTTFIKISDHFKVINEKLDDMKTDISNINHAVMELKENDYNQNKALVESMRDRIQQRCRYFTNVLHGIPENELGSLIDSLNAYINIQGNHGLQKEVQKCVDTLPILPVTIVKFNEEQDITKEI